jgi:hypothetical protein
MAVVTPPTIVPRSGPPPEDDLDGLLRAFFKAEMPDPWPSLEAPAPRNGVLPLRRPKAPRFTLWRSRLALAASILLLIAGALFLIGGSRNDVDSSHREEITTSAGKDPLPTTNIVIDKEHPEKGAGIQIEFDIPMK